MIAAINTLFAQTEQLAPIESLDPPTRSVVMMALLGVLLIGVLMILGVMVAGRWTRRIARGQPKPRDWSQEPKPWEQVGDLPALTPWSDTSSRDTRNDPPQKDTRAD